MNEHGKEPLSVIYTTTRVRLYLSHL